MAINLTSGFSPKGPWPLDERSIVDYPEDLENIDSYNGMLVYVNEEGQFYVKTYDASIDDVCWKPLASALFASKSEDVDCSHWGDGSVAYSDLWAMALDSHKPSSQIVTQDAKNNYRYVETPDFTYEYWELFTLSATINEGLRELFKFICNRIVQIAIKGKSIGTIYYPSWTYRNNTKSLSSELILGTTISSNAGITGITTSESTYEGPILGFNTAPGVIIDWVSKRTGYRCRLHLPLTEITNSTPIFLSYKA